MYWCRNCGRLRFRHSYYGHWMTCEICEIIRDCECASAREKPEEQPEEPAGTIVEYGMWEGLYHPNHNPEFAPIGQARPFKQEGWGQRQEWEE